MTTPLADGEPTAEGWTLAPIVESLPEPLAWDLFRMLGHLLHAPTNTDRRYERLELIVRCVLADGAAPGIERYQRERADRAAHGEDWPEASVLIKHYAGWERAVRAALELYRIGTRSRVSHSARHLVDDTPDFTRFEMIEALISVQEKLGHWPAKEEYRRWAQLERHVARATHGVVRYPSLPPFRNHFGRGGFDKATRAAQAAYARQSDARARLLEHQRTVAVANDIARRHAARR